MNLFDISNKNLNKVFYSKNFCKSQADNDSNKIFLSRLMKAREEEQYKKNCLLNNNNNRIEYYGNNKRLKKSLSQKDSLVYKNNLHNSIFSLLMFFILSKYNLKIHFMTCFFKKRKYSNRTIDFLGKVLILWLSNGIWALK